METPAFTRMAPRSQDADSKTAKPAAQQDDDRCPSDKGHRVALVDITNDSPIVGLAAGSAILKTPGSSAVKAQARRRMPLRTPGSGEALLRCQVKTLLQKVEEEIEQPMVTKPSFTAAVVDDPMAEVPFKILLGHLRSPSGLVAPTPANTPVLLGLPGGDNRGLSISLLEQACYEASIQKSAETTYAAFGSALAIGDEKERLTAVLEECQLNRALLFDSPGKSDAISSPADSSSCGSAVTYQGSAGSTNEKCPSSAWSIQTQAGSVEEEEELEEEHDEDVYAEEEELEEEDEEDVYSEEECSDEGAEVLMLEGLCQDLSKMTVEVEEDDRRVNGKLPEFTGKHTRFVYNSEGEIVDEDVASSDTGVPPSPGVVLLKGLPTPKGKHLRFHEEEEDE